MSKNYFDQFDEGGGSGNYFDQFDEQPNDFQKAFADPGAADRSIGFGALKGLAGLGDSIAGLGELAEPVVSPWTYVARGGKKQPKISLTKTVDSLYKPENPTAYKFGEFAGPALLPVPSALGQAKSLGQAFKIGGREGAAFSGISDLGAQWHEKGSIDPFQTAVATGLGGIVGGGGAAGLHGVGEVFGKVFKQKPKATPEVEAPKQNYFDQFDNEPGKPLKTAEDLERIGLINRAGLNEDDLAVLAAMREPPAVAEPQQMSLFEPQQNIPESASFPARETMPVSENIPIAKRNDIRNLEQTVAGMSNRFTEPPKNIDWQQPLVETPDLTGVKTPNLLHSKLPDSTELPPSPVGAPMPKEYFRRVNSPEPIVSPHGEIMPIPGDARFQLERDAKGQLQLGAQRGNLGDNLADYAHVLTPEEQALLRQYGGLKYATSKVSARNKKLLEDIWAKLPDNLKEGGAVQVGRHFLQDLPDEVRLSFEGQQQADALKYNLADKLADPRGGGIRATLSGDVPFDPIAVPEFTNDYHSLYGPVLDRALQQQANLEKQFKTLRGRITKGDITGKAQTALRAVDPNAQLQVSFDLPGGIKANVEHANPQVQKKFFWEDFVKQKNPLSKEAYFAEAAKAAGKSVDEFAQAAQGRWEQYNAGMQAIKAQFTKRKPQGIGVKAAKRSNALSNALGVAGLGALASDGQEAQAATGPTSTQRKTGAGTALGIGLLVSAVAAKNPALFNAFIKSTANHLAFAYRDTLDHVRNVDDMIARATAGNPQQLNMFGQKPKSLERRLLEHNVAALQSQWGVKFESQNLKAAALEALKTRQLSPIEARNGMGIFKDLNQAQRDAVLTFYLARKSLANDVKAYVDQVQQLFPRGTKLSFNEQQSIQAIQGLNETLNPGTHVDAHVISKLLGQATSNTMDTFFNLNPKHHLLNLTDSVIAGGSRLGPLRMFRANNELLMNPRIRQLFKDSNIFGGYKGDTSYYSAQVANKSAKKPMETFDFKSDQFNAERVALASWLQYFDANEAALKKQGIKSGTDFAEKLLSNKIGDPDTAMDAWVEMAEQNLRVLGVDPFKVNKNFVNRMKESSVLAVFVNQPMRIARLVHEYVSNGQFGKLGTFVTMTGLLGGAAVIPQSVQYAWKNTDPNSYASASAFLNDWSLGGLAARAVPGASPWIRSIEDKVGWDFMPGSGAAFNPALAGVGQNISGIGKGLESHNYGAAGMSAAKLAAGTVLPKVGPIPTGQLIRTAEGAMQSLSGKMPVAYYGKGLNPIPGAPEGALGDQRFGNKQEIDLRSIPNGEFIPIANIVAPGEPWLVQQMQKAQEEQALRKKHKQVVKPERQAYPPPKVKTVKKK